MAGNGFTSISISKSTHRKFLDYRTSVESRYPASTVDMGQVLRVLISEHHAEAMVRPVPERLPVAEMKPAAHIAVKPDMHAEFTRFVMELSAARQCRITMDQAIRSLLVPANH